MIEELGGTLVSWGQGSPCIRVVMLWATCIYLLNPSEAYAGIWASTSVFSRVVFNDILPK